MNGQNGNYGPQNQNPQGNNPYQQQPAQYPQQGQPPQYQQQPYQPQGQGYPQGQQPYQPQGQGYPQQGQPPQAWQQPQPYNATPQGAPGMPPGMAPPPPPPPVSMAQMGMGTAQAPATAAWAGAAKTAGTAAKGISIAKLIPMFILSVAIIISSSGYLVWNGVNAASPQPFADGEWVREDGNATLTISRDSVKTDGQLPAFNFHFDVMGTVYEGEAVHDEIDAYADVEGHSGYIALEVVSANRRLLVTSKDLDDPLPDGYYVRKGSGGGAPGSSSSSSSSSSISQSDTSASDSQSDSGAPLPQENNFPDNEVFVEDGAPIEVPRLGPVEDWLVPDTIPGDAVCDPEWYRAGVYLCLSGDYLCTKVMVTDEDVFFDDWYSGSFGLEGEISYDDAVIAVEAARQALFDMEGDASAPVSLTLSMNMPNIPSFFNLTMGEGSEYPRTFQATELATGKLFEYEIGYTVKGCNWSAPGEDCMQICRIYGNSSDEVPMRIYGWAATSADEEPYMMFDFHFYQTPGREPEAVGVIGQIGYDGVATVCTAVFTAVEYQTNWRQAQAPASSPQ